MIETTGIRQREAWRDKVLPPVEQVRPGMWSIPVPMPGNPLRYVLVYALALDDGLALVDTGWDSEESWTALTDGIRATGHDVSDVRIAAITHLHPDHFGLVPRVQAASGAAVAMHAADAAFLAYRTPDALRRMKRESDTQLACLGAPEPVVDAGLIDLVRLAEGQTVDVMLGDGDTLDLPGWSLRAVWTPGHTPGHLCFVEETTEVVFTGDHVLPRISPNISVIPGQLPNPLDRYLASLRRTALMPDGETLPAHEYRFRGLAARARDLLHHHDARLDEIAAAVTDRPESTAWDVAAAISWSRPFADMNANLGRLAVRETYSHLLVLASGGRVAGDGPSPVRWSPAPTPVSVP
ncbi:MBL fold metallo-hydrolase [Rhodococcus sp. HNM0569]|uniref:MBL fold metallo-hydrolase n=1 Tax=Rhodococcus sp. HNM0569 TaxID=2716340 RepID=UPI00146F6918|nr:MBL fold metallo-hydrolase [Rhodococcus sp. HNM0569]NLU83787.1 MBL fold metallo-hydrolase [Rhodococcus sp. HNM0569]